MEEPRTEELVGFRRNPRCKGRETEMRNAKSERFFWTFRRGGYGGAKGRGRDTMVWTVVWKEMSAGWYRRGWGSRRRQRMLLVDEQGKKKERRNVRAEEWCSEGLCNQQWRSIVWRLGATIRGYGTVSAFSHAAGTVRSMVNAADDYALASPSPDN